MEQEHSLGNQTEEGLAQLAGLFRVLAEPNRLRIVVLLLQRETCVCELLPQMGISQPLLSHHLSVLTEAGLIRPRRQAQRIYYAIVPEALARLKGLFLAHLDPARRLPEGGREQGAGCCAMLEGAAQAGA